MAFERSCSIVVIGLFKSFFVGVICELFVSKFRNIKSCKELLQISSLCRRRIEERFEAREKRSRISHIVRHDRETYSHSSSDGD